jgi:hypothetical protein
LSWQNQGIFEVPAVMLDITLRKLKNINQCVVKRKLARTLQSDASQNWNLM